MIRKSSTGLIAVLMTGCIIAMAAGSAHAQFQNRWLAVGSYHNWYSEVGVEIEHGNQPFQQFGKRYPGIYRFQDMQAAKGFWIGARNVQGDGQTFSHRVVHVGPRASGAGAFFPREFRMVSRFDPPQVLVDGLPSFDLPVDNDEVEPDIPVDRMLINTVNTRMGITMERRIMQFANEHHDNYHIIEYTFTNTGVDEEGVNVPDQTLEDLYFFFQYRLSVVRETRYVIGNHTGWGRNAMVDGRGDGVTADPPGEAYRAQFVWHGFDPTRDVAYNNIGGPIWRPAVQIAATDTLGRLGATHFTGVLTLHADTSPNNPANDPQQPRTTTQVASDDPLNSQNDVFNESRMEREYGYMTQGRTPPHHAWRVEPSGDFANQRSAPNIPRIGLSSGGESGGWSIANGYGPYTLAPGESIRIVLAEAAHALSREAALEIGRAYKESGGNDNLSIPFEVGGTVHSMTKNEWVMTVRDSLMQTFGRITAAFENNYDIPEPPYPPSVFNVDSGGDRISLSWETYNEGPAISGWEVYRATGREDSTYTLIASLDAGSREYEDRDVIRGIGYFYYLQAVGLPGDNDGSANTPPGALRSNRYYAQTYDPAFLRRQPGPPPSRMQVELPLDLLQDGENEFAFEKTGGRGFQVQRLLLTLEVCEPENGDPCARIEQVTHDPITAPIDMRDIAAGTRETVRLNIDLDPVQSAELMLGMYELQNVGDVRFFVNETEVSITDEVLAPEDPLSAIRIVPNPYNLGSSPSVRWPDVQDRLAFLNVPGEVTIRIYTELGELIETIEHADGSGDAFWDLTTLSRQIIVSGVYIAVFDTPDGRRVTRKFVIVR